MAVSPKIVVANPGGLTSAVDGLVTFPFDQGSYTVGTTPDGIKYVVAPNGVKINAPSPARENVSGREKHGCALNMNRASAPGFFHPFDNNLGLSLTYDINMNASFPAILRPGDCLIKASSAATVAESKVGFADQFGILHVVASAPPANAFAAPFLWPAADKANRPWRTVDIDARLAELPSLSAGAMPVISWNQLKQYWDRVELGQAFSPSTASGGYEMCAVKNFSGGGSTVNYDRNQHNIFKAVMIGLMLNSWSAADKRAALIRMLQHGCQRGETIVKFGAAVEPDGGHARSQYACAMAWLWATGRQSEYATWLPLVAGSVKGQFIQLTSTFLADCVVHSDNSKPFPWRRRLIENVTGTTIRVDAFRDAGTQQGDGTNPVLSGLNMVRESDGRTAFVTSMINSDPDAGYFDIVIDAQPSPAFAIGDTVYFPPPFSLTTDSWDFILTNNPARKNFYNPSPDAAYRELGHDMISHLFCHAIGMHGADMDGALSYSQRACESNNPAGHDLPSHCDVYGQDLHGGTGNISLEQQFYDTHGATLLALPQDV